MLNRKGLRGTIGVMYHNVLERKGLAKNKTGEREVIGEICVGMLNRWDFAQTMTVLAGPFQEVYIVIRFEKDKKTWIRKECKYV